MNFEYLFFIIYKNYIILIMMYCLYNSIKNDEMCFFFFLIT